MKKILLPVLLSLTLLLSSCAHALPPSGLNTTEDDTQAVKDPEPATALEPKPEAKKPKPAKSHKTTGGKTTKGATKSTKANKTEKE